MPLEGNNKVLFVVGINQDLDFDFIKQRYHFHKEDITIIESDELNRIQPFGDLMRNILIQVYVKNIEEIYIARDGGTSNSIQLANDENPLRKEHHTLNYLFNHCKTEFPNRSITEWFVGNDHEKEDKQNTIEVIRRHPLMPKSVKVKELKQGECSLGTDELRSTS